MKSWLVKMIDSQILTDFDRFEYSIMLEFIIPLIFVSTNSCPVVSCLPCLSGLNMTWRSWKVLEWLWDSVASWKWGLSSQALLLFRSFGGGCTIFATLPLIVSMDENGSPNPQIFTRGKISTSWAEPSFLSPLLVPYFLAPKKNGWQQKPWQFQPHCACRLVRWAGGSFIRGISVTSSNTMPLGWKMETLKSCRFLESYLDTKWFVSFLNSEMHGFWLGGFVWNHLPGFHPSKSSASKAPKEPTFPTFQSFSYYPSWWIHKFN